MIARLIRADRNLPSSLPRSSIRAAKPAASSSYVGTVPSDHQIGGAPDGEVRNRIAAARAKGKHSGRRPLDADKIAAALSLVKAGLSPTAPA
jgi:hypothetical protein